MYAVETEMEGVVHRPFRAESYITVADEAERVWGEYQYKVLTNPRHPNVTVRIVDLDKNISFAPRKVKRMTKRLTNYEQGQCVTVKVNGIPALAKITHYNPGSPGDTGGPVRSYASINPPEPMELEWELYDRKGYRARWLEDKDDDDIERQIWAKLER